MRLFTSIRAVNRDGKRMTRTRVLSNNAKANTEAALAACMEAVRCWDVIMNKANESRDLDFIKAVALQRNELAVIERLMLDTLAGRSSDWL